MLQPDCVKRPPLSSRQALLPSRYRIVVDYVGGLQTTQKYALAWWAGESPSLPGDFDKNGSVGPEDYDVWAATLGLDVTAGTGADGNGNGVIDAADYIVWRNAVTAGSGSFAAVPEPSSALLIIGGLICGIAGSRYRFA